MTYRDLLAKLSKLGPEELDMDVVVCHRDGHFYGVSDTLSKTTEESLEDDVPAGHLFIDVL